MDHNDEDRLIGGISEEEQKLQLEKRINKLNGLIADQNFGILDDSVREVKSFRILDVNEKPLVIMSSGRNDPRLVILEAKMTNGEEKPLEVFVKALPAEAIEKELDCYSRCISHGINTFKPVIVLDENVDPYYCTHRQNIIPFSKCKISSFKDFQYLLTKGCEVYDKLHNAGIKHQDAKPKNIGINPDDDTVWVYDFEDSKIVRPGTLSQKDKLDDILEFVISMRASAQVQAKFAARKNNEHWYNKHQFVADDLVERIKQRYMQGV